MPRRPAPSDSALAALNAAAAICDDIDECGDLVDRRDALWDEANLGGVPYVQIAEACGFSEHTVRLHVSRRRGAEWAQGGRSA